MILLVWVIFLVVAEGSGGFGETAEDVTAVTSAPRGGVEECPILDCPPVGGRDETSAIVGFEDEGGR